MSASLHHSRLALQALSDCFDGQGAASFGLRYRPDPALLRGLSGRDRSRISRPKVGRQPRLNGWTTNAQLRRSRGPLHDDSELDGPSKNNGHRVMKHAMGGLVPATRCPADANPRICIAKLIPRINQESRTPYRPRREPPSVRAPLFLPSMAKARRLSGCRLLRRACRTFGRTVGPPWAPACGQLHRTLPEMLPEC